MDAEVCRQVAFASTRMPRAVLLHESMHSCPLHAVQAPRVAPEAPPETYTFDLPATFTASSGQHTRRLAYHACSLRPSERLQPPFLQAGTPRVLRLDGLRYREAQGDNGGGALTARVPGRGAASRFCVQCRRAFTAAAARTSHQNPLRRCSQAYGHTTGAAQWPAGLLVRPRPSRSEVAWSLAISAPAADPAHGLGSPTVPLRSWQST